MDQRPGKGEGKKARSVDEVCAVSVPDNIVDTQYIFVE